MVGSYPLKKTAGPRRIRTGLRRLPPSHQHKPKPKPKPNPNAPSPPPPPRNHEPIPFLTRLKSISDPSAALSLLITAGPIHQTHPALSSLLLRLVRAHRFTHVPALLSLAFSRHVPLSHNLLGSLITHYGRAHLPGDALRLFESLPRSARSTQTLNFLLNALVDNGLLSQATSLASSTRIRPNIVSYNILLKGVLAKDGIEDARQMLDEMPRRNVRPSVVTYNMLIGFACRNGDTGLGMKLKEEMMKKGLKPNAVTYGILMEGLCLDGRHADAKKVMFDMDYQGCKATVANYGVLMSDCGRRGDIEGMRTLLAEMKQKKMKPDGVVYSILVNYLCVGGRVDEAYKMLVEMQMKGEKPCAAVYRMMVDGFCQEREFGKGLMVLNAMLLSGHCPRGESFECLISGLCEGGRVDDAYFVLEEMVKRKKRLNAVGWGALVEAVCGVCDDKTAILGELTSINTVDDRG